MLRNFLSRSNAEHNEVFANHATTIIMLNALTEIGLHRIVENHPAFINFAYDFLLGEHKTPEQHNQIVLEILKM